MSHSSRRTFLKLSAGAGAAFALPYLVPGAAFGANDEIRIAMAGIHGRGQSHIDEYAKIPGCKITYLVDPDSRLFASRSKVIQKKFGIQPKCVQDIRKALEDPNVDAVSVATCNHWHSLITIWACQANKDVYVEKPCSQNLHEGRKCLEAARKYNRIVQHGTQSRSSSTIGKMVAAIHSGKYGKLLVAKGYCCKPRWSIGFKEIKQPPPELDFNIWLGPSPVQPYHENLVHYNWHWFWNTGNGDMGNQGVHEMDVCRWAIGKTLPKSVVSLGGRWVDEPEHFFKDQGQTPNMELSVYDYDGTMLIFETRGLVAKKDAKRQFPGKVGYDFFLEEGAILLGERKVKGKLVRDYQFYPKGSTKPEPIVDVPAMVKPGGHFGNFINCVRSRNRNDLNAEILQGHLSAALCHLGNISYRLGKPGPFAKSRKDYPECQPVEDSIRAIDENLSGALDLDDLTKQTCQYGPKLQFDAQAEKFVGCPAADALLTRKPRPPFVVPETV